MRKIILPIVITCILTVAHLTSAQTITFELTPGAMTPADDSELLQTPPNYIDGGTTLNFGFDTGSDDVIDVNARFEDRSDSGGISGYLTGSGQDTDLSGTMNGGDWMLRNPKSPEPNPVDLMGGNRFLIVYSGTPVTSLSGQIWDVDNGEQYRVEVLSGPLGSVLDSVDSPVGQGTGMDGPGDGTPFTFSFEGLSPVTPVVRITQIAGPTAGFAFDNFNASQPAPPETEPVSVPTLSEWGIIGLILLLGGAAFVKMRRLNLSQNLA